MGRVAQEFADVPYEDLEPGVVRTTTHRLDPSLVAEYERLVGPSPDGSVSPWVFCTFLPMYRALGGRMEQGSIHTRQRMVEHRPVSVGATLTVELRVLEKIEEGGRRHVTLEIVFADEAGPVCSSTGTYLWGHATR
ncbi:hypothetical protein EV188_11480 [Actinomycetospora succinea]|uniref:MaoC dehydratase-like protein n=1 Tax=Actinomycetospora succinea TaxID=663603 RepID=A0A4R6UK92_9PSEU|nr:hypothetical protein [Actinomycetospora succinea]TDQ46992.1 hypothetical protein EV188_11480 [Actinomycetospora succinea]